jgi:hypothetical protein
MFASVGTQIDSDTASIDGQLPFVTNLSLSRKPIETRRRKTRWNQCCALANFAIQ